MAENLGISTVESALLAIKCFLDSIEMAVKKFHRHPSICKIKERNRTCNKFEFRGVAIANRLEKASPINSIPAKDSDVFVQSFKSCTTLKNSKICSPKN